MLVLGVDTSWKHGSIALVRGRELLGAAQLEGGTFSAQLVPQIAHLLSQAKLKKSDLDGFAVVSGPGSFTGLRVGLAAVKGLAEVLQKPIATATVLEAMVLETGKQGKLAAVLDAGRGELYLGEYEVRAESDHLQARGLRELVVTRFDAPIALKESRTVCCEQSVADLLRESGLELIEQPRPDSAAIARIGGQKIARGAVTTTAELDANYIRRSDAELFSAPKP